MSTIRNYGLKSRLLCFSLTCVFFGTGFMAGAEDFRVKQTHIVEVSAKDGRSTESIGVNDALVIVLPEDKTFIEGVELSFKVPKIVAEWRDSVAWSVYGSVSPAPSEKRIDYSAERLQVGTFGSSLSLNMQIPFSDINTIKRNPYSIYMDDLPPNRQNFIFIRTLLAMKGASDEIPESRFEVSVRPLLIDKGRLSVKLLPPEGTEMQSYTAFVDGKAVDKIDGILLSTGNHDVSLVSDFYRNELRRVNISQAQTTELVITFRDIAPTIRIAAPEGTKVFLDDEELSLGQDLYKVLPGDHVVKFVVGDYEIIRNVKAENGHGYSVSLTMDATLSEE